MARILIIEDEEKIRNILAISLGLEGHDVETSPNGEEGLRKMGSFAPQILVLDYKLPDYEGSELLSEIRHFYKRRNLPTIPIILLTGLDKDELELGEEYFQEVYFVPKPFENQALVELIRKILS